MSRICELPSEVFPFRYYIHDPWWINSPWYDRYDSTPCDIYLPMAISRINKCGEAEAANSLNLLSIDNSYGDLPDACVNEPLPHLLKAEKDAADEPAPLVWVYPMSEYTTANDESLLREMNLGDNYICDAINDGLPLCCVVSTDNFLLHDIDVYKKSILISPVPENPAVLDKLTEFLKRGIGTVIYGTAEQLRRVGDLDGLIKLNVEKSPALLREAIASFGYSISFIKNDKNIKPPTVAIARHNNGLFFSVYNANTTTDIQMRFPFGAPILCGAETAIENGTSSYRFTRGEHRECRIFADQAHGLISCREAPPVNVRFRRAIKISGLEDATLCLFSEKNCESAVSLAEADLTPEFDQRFTAVSDEIHGTYLKGEHISGTVYFLIWHKK